MTILYFLIDNIMICNALTYVRNIESNNRWCWQIPYVNNPFMLKLVNCIKMTKNHKTHFQRLKNQGQITSLKRQQEPTFKPSG